MKQAQYTRRALPRTFARLCTAQLGTAGHCSFSPQSAILFWRSPSMSQMQICWRCPVLGNWRWHFTALTWRIWKQKEACLPAHPLPEALRGRSSKTFRGQTGMQMANWLIVHHDLPRAAIELNIRLVMLYIKAKAGSATFVFLRKATRSPLWITLHCWMTAD